MYGVSVQYGRGSQEKMSRQDLCTRKTVHANLKKMFNIIQRGNFVDNWNNKCFHEDYEVVGGEKSIYLKFDVFTRLNRY